MAHIFSRELKTAGLLHAEAHKTGAAFANYGAHILCGADSRPQGFAPEHAFFGRLPEIAENTIGNACAGFSPRQPDREKMEKLLKACCYDNEADF